jgi:hypothetical protein
MKLDFLLRELHFQFQRVGEAIGEVGEAGQQVDVDDFWFGEVLAQDGEISVTDVVGRARQFFDIDERRALFLAVAGIIPRLQCSPAPQSTDPLTKRHGAAW